MARLHRVDHLDHLGATDLADDDAVRTHTQRVAHKVAHGDCAKTFAVGGACLEPHHVCSRKCQFGGVLDRDHPFGRADGRGEGVEQGGLSRARRTDDQDVRPAAHSPGEQLHLGRTGQRREIGEPASEPTDAHTRPVDRDGRHHDVDARPVGQPSVDAGRGVIDPPPHRTEHAFDEALERRTIDKHVGELEHAVALHPDRTGAVDEHLGHALVVEQRAQHLERNGAHTAPSSSRFSGHWGKRLTKAAKAARTPESVSGS